MSTKPPPGAKRHPVLCQYGGRFYAYRTTSSIQKALTDENHRQLCRDLSRAVKIVGTIKPLSQRKNYVAVFDEKIDRSNEAVRNNFYNYTDAYIVACLENDLSEKTDKNNK